ncbi:MAG: hypothetical protein IJZ75_01960 [Clostridia bacterium]|nr:hypothetical protein [Clostridia bacterium]
MISVSPLKDMELVKKLFCENKFDFNENSGCVAAVDGDEVLGMCLYYLDNKGITVLSVEPKEDIMLADGILRSALHVAAQISAMDARYQGAEYEELFARLGFIKEKENKTLDIDKLFGGCCCSKNL